MRRLDWTRGRGGLREWRAGWLDSLWPFEAERQAVHRMEDSETTGRSYMASMSHGKEPSTAACLLAM
jgi:hypothetical protein